MKLLCTLVLLTVFLPIIMDNNYTVVILFLLWYFALAHWLSQEEEPPNYKKRFYDVAIRKNKFIIIDYDEKTETFNEETKCL